MMTNMEMVEKLREKANVSYADAKDALARANWDLLDAMILLEGEGKVPGVAGAPQSEYSTKSGAEAEAESAGDYGKKRVGATFSELIGRFFRWVGKLFNLGNTNMFLVEKNGATILSTPVTVLVLLLIVGFWAIIPLLIVGLFFGYSYSFAGPNLGRDDVNNAMDKASGVADSIKNEINKL